jgi:hypothetical protein
VLLVILGVGALVSGIWKSFDHRDVIADAGSAVGVVTLIKREEIGNKRSQKAQFTFRVKFATASGENVEGWARNPWRWQQFQMGQSVPVAYVKGNPKDFNIPQPPPDPAEARIAFGAALGFIGVGASALWYMWRRHHRKLETRLTLAPMTPNPQDRNTP